VKDVLDVKHRLVKLEEFLICKLELNIKTASEIGDCPQFIQFL